MLIGKDGRGGLMVCGMGQVSIVSLDPEHGLAVRAHETVETVGGEHLDAALVFHLIQGAWPLLVLRRVGRVRGRRARLTGMRMGLLLVS
jgi:hypothetical protein